MRYPIQKMTVGQILDTGFSVFRNNFKVLFGIAAYFLIPAWFIFQFISNYLKPHLGHSPTQAELQANLSANLTIMILSFVAFIIWICILSPITSAATTWAVSREYLDEPATAGQAFRAAIHLFVPVIKTGILKGLLITLGYICFIIPGVYLSFRYALSGSVVVIEGVSGMEALRRSKFLMKDNVTKIFLVFLVVGLLNAGLGAATNLVPGIFFNAVAASVVTGMVYIFSATVYVVFYFHARAMVENFDLSRLADIVEGPQTPEIEQPLQ
jgi:hypothetical protein